MIFRSLQYDFPEASLVFFFLFPIIVLIFALYRYRQNKLGAFAQNEVLKRIMVARNPVLFWIKAILFCACWIFAVLALMQPKGNERYLVAKGEQVVESTQGSPKDKLLKQKMHEVIFLLDVSSSMAVDDVRGTKTREEVAKGIIDDVISQLRGENVSLYAFTSETLPIVPSTTDYLFTRIMAKDVQINEGETAGTNIAQALEYVQKKYFAIPNSRPKTLILLTDGGDTQYESTQGESQAKILQEILKPIENAEAEHLRVLIVGIGSPQGKNIPDVSFEGQPIHSALNLPLLRRLMIASQGQLFLTDEMPPLQIAREIARDIENHQAFEDRNALASEGNDGEHLYDFYFQFPLAIAIMSLALCLVLPDTRKRNSVNVLPYSL